MNDTKKLTRVRLLTAIAGGPEGELGEFSFHENEIVDIPTSVAEKWCAGSVAMLAPYAKTKAEIKQFQGF
jgi:hypothetical protein